jgi:hypothetical protein
MSIELVTKLKEENELLRMQLAACGAATLANTKESIEAIQHINLAYKTSSFNQIVAMVKREISLRAKLKKYEGR